MEWEFSDQVAQAEWIAERQPPDASVCTIPAGFSAYARLLHPIQPTGPEPGFRSAPPARWAQVARWSGAVVGAATRFWQLALPESLPAAPVPGGGEPASDVLGPHDGAALARILRAHTGTPQQCWFGLWDGYGWIEPGVTVRADDPARFPAEPVEHPPRPGWAPAPGGGRPGPLVRLPGRDYLLYAGPVEAGLAFLPEQRELADLWWPQDRAWFVYGDVDLNSTYVAGSIELIAALLGSAEVEAVAADPVDPVVTGPGEMPGWLASRIEATVSDLLAGHRAELSTSRFTARFELASPVPGRWRLHYRCDDPSRARGHTLLSDRDLAVQLRRTIVTTIVDVVEG